MMGGIVVLLVSLILLSCSALALSQETPKTAKAGRKNKLSKFSGPV